MENGPFIDDFPIKTSIYKGFSMAMLNNQMVNFSKSNTTNIQPIRRAAISSAQVESSSHPKKRHRFATMSALILGPFL